MNKEEFINLKAKCLEHAQNSHIDTSEIPEITDFGGFWRRQDHDKCAPIAAHYYRSGYSDGHAAAMKEVQDALAALIASSKQSKSGAITAQHPQREDAAATPA